MNALKTTVVAAVLVATGAAFGQHSVARQWNELCLESIRRDQARPPIHARNLYHLSVGMWDIWAAYDDAADQVLVHERQTAEDPDAAREEAICYMAYRLLSSRFINSPGAAESLPAFEAQMDALGFDTSNFSVVGDTPAAFGNRVAAHLIAYGLGDGSNEAQDYDNNIGYEPVNPPLVVGLPGNPDLELPNRWQPLALDFFIDQSGINIGEYPDFLGPHWGQVPPFALSPNDLADLPEPWYVYHDPGTPPYLGTETDQEYKDVFAEVVYYSSLLDPTDNVMIDISPAVVGNRVLGTYDDVGHPVNPATGQPYPPNVVNLADWGRCIAEFWADGPDSETPPGHWVVVANDAVDHPMFERRMGGQGAELDQLQWDIKMYLAVCAAGHDAAIAAWGIKGYYDYIRPISAIRYMAGKGQSSHPQLPSYHEEGIPLQAGLVELITPETIAEGGRHEHLVERFGDFIIDDHLNEIAVYAWTEPEDPSQLGGVNWMLAADWIPYQLPTFVTPPFAGYVSGHSTYSRAAAEVLVGLTGTEYFPGGMAEYSFDPGFLRFESGPSESFTIQWATFYDAADEAGISRLYGGIHPSVDDLPGRILGKKVGDDVWRLVQKYFNGQISCPADLDVSRTVDIVDLLLFLDGYFSSDGDFNGDGDTSILDLLEFLDVYLDVVLSGGACPAV